MTGSLAFATDLALLAHQGASVERHDGWTAVRSAANPLFRWGNFVLVPSADDPDRVAELHAEAFPDAGFITAGIDDPQPALDEARWTAAGFSVERNAVLTAAALTAPPTGPAVRELRAPDWPAVVAIDLEDAEEDSDEHREFVERRTAGRRAMVEAGRAVWMGVDVGGGIVATAGIADAGNGTARYQDVGTLAAHRRRGYASAVVAALAARAADRFGTCRLVIVAEPDGPAIGLYRRLGFRDSEQQVQLERRP